MAQAKNEEQIKRKRSCEFSCSQCENRLNGTCPHEVVKLSFRPEQLENIKKNGMAGNDIVIFINADTQQALVLSNTLPNITLEDLIKDGAIHQQAWAETLKRGVHHYEWSLEKDGKVYLFQTTVVAMQDETGNVTGGLSLSRDITKWGVVRNRVLRDGSAPRTLSQILLSAREMEKKDISKALHDEVGSVAVILTALLSVVKARVKKGEQKQALSDISRLDAQIKASIERIKNIVVSLRPPSLENEGALGGAIRELLDNISELTHIPYQFDYKPISGQSGVSDQVKILLYRIVQESLNNIVKHAQAKNIYVLLEKTDTLRLVVQDDGVGFNVRKQNSIRHIGLLAMKDGVKLLGGKISIKSAPGKGTRIEVVCPCVVYGGNE
ncbi:MAG: hypothetical protein IKA93_03905 [Elusimicrobiaceae bacterium]|nr:hypothetical protein [Elusimicrobiaceae bacterium]